MTIDNPTEYQDCVTLSRSLDLLQSIGKILFYSHIPQETFTKSWGTKMKNKLMGVHKGVPDYIIVTHTQVYFLEMKRRKGGVVSPEQKHCLEILRNKTTETFVARGIDEALNWIDQVVLPLV